MHLSIEKLVVIIESTKNADLGPYEEQKPASPSIINVTQSLVMLVVSDFPNIDGLLINSFVSICSTQTRKHDIAYPDFPNLKVGLAAPNFLLILFAIFKIDGVAHDGFPLPPLTSSGTFFFILSLFKRCHHSQQYCQ